MPSSAPSFFPPLVWIVGFSGHRPKGEAAGRSDAELNALKPVLAAQLAALAAKAAERGGTLALATGAAAGADVVIAEAARELKIPLHLFLPLPEPEFDQDLRELPEWRHRSLELIRHAQAGENGSTLRVTEGASTRPECYYDCGVQIIEAADAMLFVWDGVESSAIGGTADLVVRARSEWAPFARAPGEHQGFTWRPIPIGIVQSAATPVTWENLENFAAPTEAGAACYAALQRAVKDQTPPPPVTPPANLLGALSAAADRASMVTRHTIKKAILAHGAAALIAAIATVFFGSGPHAPEAWEWPAKIVLSTVELILVSLAWLTIFRLHKSGSRAHWLRLRPAAELVRSLRTSALFLDPLFPLILRHLPEWRRFSLSMALALRAEGKRMSLDEAKAAYLQDRIDGQKIYYQKKLQSATGPHLVAQAVSHWCSLLAIPFVAYALIGKIFHLSERLADSPWHGWHAFASSLLPVALPLLAGIATAYQGALDSGRRFTVYREMIERLEGFRRTVETVRTETALCRIVSAIEEVLIDEQIEWRTATRSFSH